MSTFKVGDRVRIIPKKEWNRHWFGFCHSLIPDITGIVVKQIHTYSVGVDFAESLSDVKLALPPRIYRDWPYHKLGVIDLPARTGRWLSPKFLEKVDKYDKTWV